ncbi:helix-turn-helix domain-containing protein [Phytohabitans flavus]|uniref:TetR family transcriptional regulator n=1 Tax=Phytohabitans flavus TaxID=1076124 RepID=A0A6F8XLS4_9ACTN|nr:TetR/AcrR family transcriptional regulator [Phytohabitans flavus]BCB74757.1 TetR family transcriptional regulator [Phytohabitans flavus]
MPPATDPPPFLRRDARRNRELFLKHARAEFARNGMDASLEQIARDAGLAIGTLYRHFPARRDLLLAAFEPKLTQFFADAETAVALADPWDGFSAFLNALCGTQACDRGFSEFITQPLASDERSDAVYRRICELTHSILGRAQAAGVVRPDITMTDILTLLWANGRITEATRQVAPNAWRRHVQLMIDGLRAGNRHDLPEPALSTEQFRQARAELASQRPTVVR